MVPFLTALIYFLLLIMSIFLICLVLIQRGKGGGLAGAFGGVGGSSAFGTKAGDVFTRVTMIAAGIWITLNMVLVILSNQRTSAWESNSTPGSASQSSFTPNADKKAPADKAAGSPTTGAPSTGAASPFDALAPANPNAVAPSPLGKGGPAAGATAPAGKGATGAAGTSLPEARPELPASPFEAGPAAPPSPLPAGSTPSGGGNNPKP